MNLLLGSLFVTVALCDMDNRLRKMNLIRKMKSKFKHQGDIRLVGGLHDYEGNVEVFHRGSWGSVCDDEWDSRNAEVVCRQLGFQSALTATHSSQFGQLDGSYIMDNVYCSGNESRLIDCHFDGWGNNDCNSDEVAGVICKHDLLPATTEKPSLKLLHPFIKDGLHKDIKLRLTGGRIFSEGRVEVQTGQSEWSGICGDSWSLLEAAVVCRQLSLGYAFSPTQNVFLESDETVAIALSGVSCRGNETKLSDCRAHNITACLGGISLAGVMCTQDLPDLVVDYNEIVRSAYLEDRSLYLLQCAMEENCLASSAYSIMKENSHNWHLETRRLLRFTAAILNKGTADFRPALPKNMWEFHQCHMHYHSMEVFASFDILSGETKVAEGHKASFCLEDNRCFAGTAPGYACANYGDQGISVNCSDIYRHNIDCQWVDITDIEPGPYTLKVAINPEFKVAEMDFENNAAICSMFYGPSSVHISNCYLTRP